MFEKSKKKKSMAELQIKREVENRYTQHRIYAIDESLILLIGKFFIVVFRFLGFGLGILGQGYFKLVPLSIRNLAFIRKPLKFKILMTLIFIEIVIEFIECLPSDGTIDTCFFFFRINYFILCVLQSK